MKNQDSMILVIFINSIVRDPSDHELDETLDQKFKR